MVCYRTWRSNVKKICPRPLGSALVVLDRVASLRVAVGAAEVEEMVIAGKRAASPNCSTNPVR